jgi:hypothetical protein
MRMEGAVDRIQWGMLAVLNLQVLGVLPDNRLGKSSIGWDEGSAQVRCDVWVQIVYFHDDL